MRQDVAQEDARARGTKGAFGRDELTLGEAGRFSPPYSRNVCADGCVRLKVL
jgi:hypothetical protein